MFLLKESKYMWRSIVLCGLLLGALLLLPLPVTFACRGGCPSGGAQSKPTVFSPQRAVAHGTATVLSDSVDYMFQFNLGQDVALIEIAPLGSSVWTPLVNANQIPLRVKNNRIVHIQQDVFDGIYTFDIRINGAVVWHNIEVRNERLIVLGYNNGPIIVAVIDHYRK
jgi:hypothetical protein